MKPRLLTYKELRHYRKATNTNWHDQKYWDLKNSKKGEAIEFALMSTFGGRTEKDIYDQANKFLKNNWSIKE